MSSLKIALSPIVIEYGNLNQNKASILEALDKAIYHRSDIICFPEYCITGYDYSKDNESANLGEPIANNEFIEKLKKLSKNHAIDIIIGVLERYENKIYNTGLYISQGQILHKHKKIKEAGPLTPGNEIKVFNTRFGKMAMIICGDLFDSDVILKLKEQKPDYVFMPMDRCLHELALCGNYKETCEYLNCDQENKIKHCYNQGFTSYKEAWDARVKHEYANEVKKYAVTTFIVNGLSSKGHLLACGGAIHVSNNGLILNEVEYGKADMLFIEI